MPYGIKASCKCCDRTHKGVGYPNGKCCVLLTQTLCSCDGFSMMASDNSAEIELQDAGYAVVGISKDSAASHQKFIDKYELPFPLIADTDTSLLQTLGAWGEKNMYGKKTMGTLRTTYLVNEQGVIEKIFTPKEIKTKIHAEQILDYLKG